jgi:hypothetical protein
MTMTGGGERYVYGITRSGAGRRLPTAGVEGRPVARVKRGPLAALVSEAPEGPVKANRRNLMAHTEVLQKLVESDCVLPMQFGVVMPSESAVADHLLAAHEDELVEQLETFDDLVEVDLKITCPEDVLLRTLIAERPELAELRDQIRTRPDDATYFERIRLGELVAAAVEEKRAALLRHVLGRVESLALSTAVGEPAHEHMLVNVAFLVDRGGLQMFDEEVERVAKELGPTMRCKYTGPLPPFHFVTTAADQGSAAWA